jgi:hypothetical protein
MKTQHHNTPNRTSAPVRQASIATASRATPAAAVLHFSSLLCGCALGGSFRPLSNIPGVLAEQTAVRREKDALFIPLSAGFAKLAFALLVAMTSVPAPHAARIGAVSDAAFHQLAAAGVSSCRSCLAPAAGWRTRPAAVPPSRPTCAVPSAAAQECNSGPLRKTAIVGLNQVIGNKWYKRNIAKTCGRLQGG